jgi:glycosyltransferase involved in cell wall biosynthesis
VDRSKIVLQGLGVDHNECTGGDRAHARQAWGVDERTIVVGHLANQSVEKGTVDLLKATSLSVSEERSTGNPDYRLVLAGPSMPNFESAFRAHNDKQHVIRLGVLSEADKRDFLAGIDIFCLPSRSDSFGLVLLEAWANRKPVVVYDAGGPSELVRHEIDGLISSCQPEALRHALHRLVMSPELRSQYGQAGLERVRDHFRWDDRLAIVRQRMSSG